VQVGFYFGTLVLLFGIASQGVSSLGYLCCTPGKRYGYAYTRTTFAVLLTPASANRARFASA